MTNLKSALGRMVAAANPQCRYERALFIIGHMRCGSTALSNIFCSREDVSGYGEAHIGYDNHAALGILVLNQLRRKSWRRQADHLFDKILHSRYDAQAVAAFSSARAIFMLRVPSETIQSIRALFSALGSKAYASDAEAADYYEERLTTMLRLWDRFAPERRIGVSHEMLTSNPTHELGRISKALGFTPPLVNSYTRPKRAMAHGAGDPLASHVFDGIVASTRSITLPDKHRSLTLTNTRIAALQALYERARQILL